MLKTLNQGLRLFLEILALVALGYWGFSTGNGGLLKTIFGLGAPIAAALLWANFGAPAAPHRLEGLARLIMEMVIFGVASYGLVAAGQTILGIIFGALFILNEVLLFVWGQR